MTGFSVNIRSMFLKSTVDTQHGPMDNVTLSAMINSVAVGKAKSMVRVGGYNDRIGIQQGKEDYGTW